MANLATDLLRTVVRAFYPTECILVIEALIIHSTLPDTDLAHVLNMQVKPLRKYCGRLKEDGLLSVQTRAERRTDGSGGFYGASSSQPGKERLTQKEWFYLNYHRAIDSIKYRMYKLNKHIESLGAPTTEKKDLACPRCKGQYTELEVVDRIDMLTGATACPRCGHELDRVEEEERTNENESMKRLNSQLDKILQLMQEIDATTVPENDFGAAVAKQKPIVRSDANPAQRTEVVDLPNKNLQSTKGLDIKPEKIAVQLQNDEDVRQAAEAAEAEARKEKERKQNQLPVWHTRSTLTDDLTALGAKEQKERLEREANSVSKADDGTDVKSTADDQNKKLIEDYWKEMEMQQARREAEERAAKEEDEDEDDDDDDDDDEFEDVDVAGTGAGTPAIGANLNGTAPPSTAVSTPALESSNATDDERDVKRARGEDSAGNGTTVNGVGDAEAVGTPAASDADDDEDEGLEFENV